MYEFYYQIISKRGLTDADICRATGISSACISAWKKRGGALNGNYLLKIARFLNVSMESFFGGDQIEWDPHTQEIVQTDDYYISDDAKEYAQFLFSNPEYRELFDASRKVKPQDLRKALQAIGLFIDEE